MNIDIISPYSPFYNLLHTCVSAYTETDCSNFLINSALTDVMFSSIFYMTLSLKGRLQEFWGQLTLKKMYFIPPLEVY